MKQFITNNKVTYNLMSFTGYKALIIFTLLLEGPTSYEDVCNNFIQNRYIKEKISIDTLRVYINSFKRLGCDVKRSRGEDKISRYQILSHPFELKITDAEIQSILKVYRNIVKSISVEEIYFLENFLEKIGEKIKNEEFTDAVNKISILKEVDKKLIGELLECCKRKEQIVISYRSPNSGTKDIEIIVDKLDVSSGKIYLYGTGLEYMEYGSFLVSRIEMIKSIKAESVIPESIKETIVTYELQTLNFQRPDIDKNEEIIACSDNKFTIRTKISNTFLLKQKLLEYGPACKVIEPEDFKNEFINLLKDMKAGYYCG